MEDLMIQWHPAFGAAMQIELSEDADALYFEEEHLLSKKPLQIDILVVKKLPDIQIRKNIGHIFKSHNIIEYKSPEDYLNINDFYKVYAYTCLYQSDTRQVNEIDARELTITFVCNYYPQSMLALLKEQRNITVEKYAMGIYYLLGDPISMQIIVISQLSKEENYWMQCLRTNLKSGGEIRELITRYETKKNVNTYQSLVDAVLRANWNEVEVEKNMCEALKELFADELQESKVEGENCFALLTEKLLEDARLEDLARAVKDKSFRTLLYKEYKITGISE